MRSLFLVAAMLAECAWADTITGTVVRVLDGDTLVVQDAAKKHYVVRLAEIDAPERRQRFWLASARSLAGLCYRKSATVDWSEREGRHYLGHVTCAGKDANAEQLRRGMAWASPQSTQPTSASYEIETYARLRRIGLWSDDKAVPPWEFAAKKR
jgi:endonuclease YncB( thermonuclease family)